MKFRWHFLIHLLIIGVIILLFYPTAKAYLFSGEPSGGDLPNSLTYIEHFQKHLTFPPASWQPFWYSGLATVRGYPWFHFYLMQPLVRLTDSFWAVEVYSLGTLFLFFFFSYCLFFYLCRNHLFSLFLTMILFFTKGSWAAVFWSGFINAGFTQLFLPLSLLLTLLYLKKKDKRFFLASAVTVGLAILGHPLIGIFFAFLPCLTALFLERKGRFAIPERIKTVFAFFLVVILIAGIVVYPLAELFLATPQVRTCTDCVWDVSVILAWFNPVMFVVPVILLLLGLPFLVFKKDKEGISYFLIFLVILIEFLIIFASVTFNLNLVPLIGGSLWPERMVWAISVILAAISAASARQFLAVFEKKLFLKIGLNLIIAGLGVVFFLNQPREIFSSFHASPGIFPLNAASTLGKYKKMEPKDLVPSWLDVNDINHRFDDLDYTVNHWWNMVFNIPNTRGYGQFTKGTFEDWNAWLWAAETGNLEMDKEAAKNSALFLFDWYAVAYFEESGRQLGQERGIYADYLLTDDVIEKKEVIFPLTFYKLRPELTSPIAVATNIPTALVVGSKVAYNDVGRALALANTNSKKLIPIRGPLRLEELAKVKLTDFDVLILNGYKYDDFNKAWKSLEEYVRNGGRLFIETGNEVKESESKTLSEIFPLKETQRASLGKEWTLELSDHPVNSGIETTKFAPLLYQDDPWKLSFVPNKSLIKEGARIILTQAGKPVLVESSLGQGKIIWSGLNLPYHAENYNNPEEARLLENILLYLTFKTQRLPEQEFTRPKPEEIIITGNKFTGVLFKETYDSGWKAEVNGKKMKVYQAGPDFMYLRVPKGLEGKIKVELLYRGSIIAWISFLLSLGTVMGSLWYIIIGYKSAGKSRLMGRLRSNLGQWWEREEE